MNSKEQIGVGVISLGWMGRLHARSYRSLSERFPELDVEARLVAAADPMEQARCAATKDLGFERAHADYRDLLADPDVDVVSIASPNYLHKEIALAAIDAGKPFWIEKPMGVSAAESREIAQAAAAAGLVNAVGFNYRHVPAIEYMRELVRGGTLGRITNARVWFIADYASSPQGPLTWRNSRAKAGAGVVPDLMSHGADLAQYIIGRIASVSAMTATFITERPIPTTTGFGHSGFEIGDEVGPVENEDYVGMLVRFDNGALATMESSRASVGPRAEYVVEVYGTEGSARWDFASLNELEVCTSVDGGPTHGYQRAWANPAWGEWSRYQPAIGTSMGFDDLKSIEAAQFIRSVLTGEQLAPSAADAWCAAEVDEAVVASAADGQWHDVARVTGTTTFDA
ncbi:MULTISPECIES: Gfo/Idh/MocA family protein [Actinomyces]|uniref:Gfo/Idh/MocA family oxidoreductase n=1 Tax=Actinomyces respiraculi TaxID=2744574 RepID=A0A7T0LK35_9ACTO|nr:MULTISPECIES: Gfo/Idh/MocA family oxidoreductase [Actinomyces]QPL04886.1 Gfo/Idh/MocA family oxidoreductase [Actinomyces respiraculi]